MTTPTRISMADGPSAAQLLVAWFSPGYPVGAFAYSHGLETLVAAGTVSDADTLERWVADCLCYGAGRTDALLLAAAHAAPEAEAPAELARALAASRERLLETEQQGAAFAATTSAAFGPALAAAPYPVAVGRAAAAHGVPLEMVLVHYLQAFAANLVSAGVRLVPIGQTAGQLCLAHLMPLIARVAREAETATLDDIGSACTAADIAAMRHETEPVRLFRT